MNILMIYESVYGNNKKVAELIKGHLEEKHEVRMLHVDQFHAGLLSDTDWLIVGSPTRVFHPMKTISRALKKVNKLTFDKGQVSLYDTRMDLSSLDNSFLEFLHKIRGTAADTMEERMSKKGLQIIGNPIGFIVDDTEGPLKLGEDERVKAWCEDIMAQVE